MLPLAGRVAAAWEVYFRNPHGREDGPWRVVLPQHDIAISPSLPADSAPELTIPAEPTRAKVRLRFTKRDELRWLCHHDLMRCFERLLRRAALPVRQSQGFHPHPRLVFALSLPLGVVGRDEVADLELDEQLPAEEVLERLRRQAPPGLDFVSAQYVPPKCSPQVRALCYRLAVPATRAAEIQNKIDELLKSETLQVRRVKLKQGDAPLTAGRTAEAGPGTALDLRPFVRDLHLHAGDVPDQLALEIELWLTDAGTAKPVEIVGLLGLMDLLDAGAVLERVRLELNEEI